MSARVFVDTNVLVYGFTREEFQKREQAIKVLDSLASYELGAISTQVLAEFFVTVTRKIQDPLTPGDAYTEVERYVRSWAVLHLTPAIVLEAARGVRDYQFSYYDAQIWATAKLNQIPVVFSEDFSIGSIIEGVRFANPFASTFNLADWM